MLYYTHLTIHHTIMQLFQCRAKRSPYTFLAFGQGPRSCIGMRFALLEVKVCLVHVLSKFSFVACDETPASLTRDPASNFGQPLEPVVVKVVERKR